MYLLIIIIFHDVVIRPWIRSFSSSRTESTVGFHKKVGLNLVDHSSELLLPSGRGTWTIAKCFTWTSQETSTSNQLLVHSKYKTFGCIQFNVGVQGMGFRGNRPKQRKLSLLIFFFYNVPLSYKPADTLLYMGGNSFWDKDQWYKHSTSLPWTLAIPSPYC